jgi:CheY-like chemotaxis protein
LVDDEDIVREMLVASLEDAGFVVLAAANGAEALAPLEVGEPVDVLVSQIVDRIEMVLANARTR